MKLLLAFTLLISLFACGQNIQYENNGTVNIYIAGCDSIFYCEGQNLNLETLKGSKKDDSIFINKKVTEFKKENKEIYIKIFGGYCGGTSGTAEDFTHLFDRKNLKWKFIEPDSLEENYFKDVSLFKAVQQLKIELNEPKEEVNLPDSKPFFQFILKANGDVYYSYDSTDMNRNLTLINNSTKEKLVQEINNVEKKHNIKLEEKQIIIRGKASARYPYFKVIKEALKAKDIFRFKIITDGPTPPKEAEKNTQLDLKTSGMVTFLLSANDIIYYYTGDFKGDIIKTDFPKVGAIIKKFTAEINKDEIMFIIKSDEKATFKNAIDILDQMTLNNVPSGRYVEIELTDKEIESIKKNKE